MNMNHWKLDIVDELATLSLDVAGQSANLLSQEVLSEFDQLLRDLEGQPLRGLIIRSTKPSGFIAGADVREFERISRIGAILPDLWMREATRKPVGAQPLLDATARALKR